MKTRLSRKIIWFFAVLVLLAAVAALTTRFNLKEHFRGIYLLKGKGRYLFEVKNDLFLGEGASSGRLIFGIDIEDPRYKLLHRHTSGAPAQPHLDCIWDEDNGSGYVMSYLPGGRALSVIFSRFIDDNGKPTHGIFVGGGLPSSLETPDLLKRNDTGMALYEGGKWYHIWCNANEAIVSGTSGAVSFPSDWKYLGSRVQRESSSALEISSAHEAAVDGVPVRIDRSGLFRVGDTYFTLTIKLTNTGTGPVTYQYCYGDEPWVGDWGNARGNVGWVKDRIIKAEQYVDTERYGYAGIYDYGNDLIGEGHGFTLKSNFLEWSGPYTPSVFFSNGPNLTPDPVRPRPLQGNARYVGLAYGPLTLMPGRTDVITVAIGACGYDEARKMPLKPSVSVDYEKDFAH